MPADFEAFLPHRVAPSTTCSDPLRIAVEAGRHLSSCEPGEPVAQRISRAHEKLLAVKDGRVFDLCIVAKVDPQGLEIHDVRRLKGWMSVAVEVGVREEGDDGLINAELHQSRLLGRPDEDAGAAFQDSQDGLEVAERLCVDVEGVPRELAHLCRSSGCTQSAGFGDREQQTVCLGARRLVATE